MKICYIGDFSRDRDEGLKNLSYLIATTMSIDNDVLMLNTKDCFKFQFWESLLTKKIDIVHYIPGPTIKSLIFTKIAGIIKNSKTVLSAPQPKFSKISKYIAYYFKPDLILVQSDRSEMFFSKLNFYTEFMPNYVDTELFKPPSDYEEKMKLRRKYSLSEDKFILLHVGHLVSQRNLDIFENIKYDFVEKVIVASEYLKVDFSLLKRLKNNGCKVLMGYNANINEIYKASDCYIFPVIPGNTIEIPLTVLEAMSCNLPVITTKLEGLVNMFQEGEGLFFVDNKNEILNYIKILKENKKIINTREKVSHLNCTELSRQLNYFYRNILENSK